MDGLKLSNCTEPYYEVDGSSMKNTRLHLISHGYGKSSKIKRNFVGCYFNDLFITKDTSKRSIGECIIRNSYRLSLETINSYIVNRKPLILLTHDLSDRERKCTMEEIAAYIINLDKHGAFDSTKELYPNEDTILYDLSSRPQEKRLDKEEDKNLFSELIELEQAIKDSKALCEELKRKYSASSSEHDFIDLLEEERECRDYEKRALILKECILRRNLKIARLTISTFFGVNDLPQDELYQLALEGLVTAIAKYDPKVGYQDLNNKRKVESFQAYAMQTICDTVKERFYSISSISRKDYLLKINANRIEDSLVQELSHFVTPSEVAKEMGVHHAVVERASALTFTTPTFTDYVYDASQAEEIEMLGNLGSYEDLRDASDDFTTILDESSCVETLVLNEVISDDICDIISNCESLTDRQKNALELYFGLNGNRTHTFEEIGNLFGVTGTRAQQMVKKAIERLKNNQALKSIKEHSTVETEFSQKQKVLVSVAS